ncbi:alkene reductase [Flammeovirga agarivorans]|uniref:Alkene reductase n=1 Tax=Flammeovirga agarivorans TaxID=2726742 RepID=A0A7X8XXM0_9BACT|nr:alkene reductase [Flammeovirga agarivorans]NLR93362.1 alkene reductase [Flammeovirga agarivorans]
MKLFSSYSLGNTSLNNRIVMAPMTRCRAENNIPNKLMAEYYAQRASAGLIITEGTAPSKNGLGYARIPGIYSEAQVEGWKKVTQAVHQQGGKIFIQLMHTGRASHPLNMEADTRVVAPSPIVLSGEMYTDSEGNQPYPVPEQMTEQDIQEAIQEFVNAAKNSIEAGADGVELHAANGYLINQFLSPLSNQRTDSYGGSAENRNRFAIEVAQAVIDAIGADKVGVRISPYGVFNDLAPFEGIDEQYLSLVDAFNNLGVVYLHLVDHSGMGAPEVPVSIKEKLKEAFNNTFIASGGLDRKKAIDILEADQGDLVAFGRPFISNPDLVHRLKDDLELTPPDFDTFYTPGEKGYTDYAFKVAE